MIRPFGKNGKLVDGKSFVVIIVISNPDFNDPDFVAPTWKQYLIWMNDRWTWNRLQRWYSPGINAWGQVLSELDLSLPGQSLIHFGKQNVTDFWKLNFYHVKLSSS